MGIINAHSGEVITLHGFTMKGDRTLENQPTGFPKIQICKISHYIQSAGVLFVTHLLRLTTILSLRLIIPK